MPVTSARSNDRTGTRKGRPVAGRPLTNIDHSGNLGDNTTALRLQLLAARYGVVGSYAVTLAALAWGGAQHG